ncbi:MraZ protein [Nocardioides scoriae]|uniref:Transcriptional regulator MraZ n=1 Tax=Nocardioides scoriae TaxID=642780 RepID=A0A1H1L7B2_9ACTN|nr:division/cell wall cluster transcriptional repressor MraZ [Nocardioides scoriae]SDR70307.1 MraZ protein [Nocardioides scoriae]
MFSGTYTPKVDEKGRLFLPAKFREEMKEGLVITRGQDRSLDLRTAADFADFTEKFKNASQTDARLRAYGRMLFALASEQVPDKQGRVSLTPELRSYAGLEREAVVIGIYDRVEIWEPSAWARYTADQEQAFANLSEEVFPGF